MSDSLSRYVYSRPLHGSEKVAVLLLALDRSTASQLLHQFEHDEIERIRTAADSLEPITHSDLETLVEEFASQVAEGMSFLGTPNEVHTLLKNALREDDSETEAEDNGAIPESEKAEASIWQRLLDLPEELLVLFMQNEHPQLAAVIMSTIEPEQSGRLIALMPQDVSTDIMRRMMSMREIDSEAMELVESLIEDYLADNADDGSSSRAHARIADMINRMDGDERQRVIDNLAAAAPEEAEAIKKLLFSFEDIIKLSETASQVLFGTVATDVTVIALHEADDTLREKILSSLSARARRMVEVELSSGTGASDTDVAAAKFKIAAIALELMRENKITLDDEEAA